MEEGGRRAAAAAGRRAAGRRRARRGGGVSGRVTEGRKATIVEAGRPRAEGGGASNVWK